MKNLPFLLKPAYKDYLWGGRKLKDEYGKETDISPLAESWECSVHPDGLSSVSGGQFDGMTLESVIKGHPEYLGTHPNGQMPILIKLIDAKKDLSVQVHPDDAYAEKHENGQNGKTELWYVLHAKKGAKLVYGFNRTLSIPELMSALDNGSIERCLNYVPVNADDVFMVEPGMVHAIGEGTVIAEIQENSNLTYRLYDYNRVGKDGKKRELHIDKAFDVLNLQSSAAPRQPMRTLNYRAGYASELLGRCQYFQVERLLLNTERSREMADYRAEENSFKVLMAIDGCGTMFGEGVMINFFKGDTIFVPAGSVELKLHGRAQMLMIGC